jgi:hypothetical protein
MKFYFFNKIIFVILFVTILSNISCKLGSVNFSCDIGENAKLGISYLQPLAEAMENYKTDNNKYPKYFNDLVPKYISEIPTISLTLPETPEWKIIRDERLGSSMSNISDNGGYFDIRFSPTDERICLLGGRNNICEYTSDTKRWGCFQH